jgi:3-keto-disaccharide hydrolase
MMRWTELPRIRKGEPMKIAPAVFLLLAASAYEIDGSTDVPRLAITAPEKTSMKDDLGRENPKWKFVAGTWTRRPSGGRQVLAQVAETQPWAVAILEDQRFDDVDVSVRFRPVSGNEDASGGVIFRARDGRNYLLVRANALENNFRLYAIVNGKRSTIASARVTEPKLGEWHKIRVVARGPKIQAYLDDALLLDHEDKTFTGGWVGLWTKADSVTEFADLAVVGTPSK